jgi:hypothetical protein
MVYVIGALKNPDIVSFGKQLSDALRGEEVFTEWHHPGPDADTFWQKDEQTRGRSFIQALNSDHAWTVFTFDRTHLDIARAGVLYLPAGKSAYAEMGYLRGQRKPVIALMPEEPERWDLMLRFASRIVMTSKEVAEALLEPYEGTR